MRKHPIYGLIESDLRTFLLVSEPVKITTLNACRDVLRGMIK